MCVLSVSLEIDTCSPLTRDWEGEEHTEGGRVGEEHTQRRLTFYVRSATLWTSGTVLFSGSIYALSLGAGDRFKMLGPITPVRSLSPCLHASFRA